MAHSLIITHNISSIPSIQHQVQRIYNVQFFGLFFLWYALHENVKQEYKACVCVLLWLRWNLLLIGLIAFASLHICINILIKENGFRKMGAQFKEIYCFIYLQFNSIFLSEFSSRSPTIFGFEVIVRGNEKMVRFGFVISCCYTFTGCVFERFRNWINIELFFCLFLII